MRIKSIRTKKIQPNEKITEVLDEYLKKFADSSILAITSKLVSTCENNIIPKKDVEKEELIYREADYYLPIKNDYGMTLTVKNNILIPTAGIDESNVSGGYILWPENPQKSANEIRKYLIKRFGVGRVGVIITDSRTSPMRTGVTGVAIAHSGFKALKDYIGKPDMYGVKLGFTKSNIIDGLAGVSVLVMGEGNEQTPLVVIDEIDCVQFTKGNPSKKELEELKIDIKNDIYGELLQNDKWCKGGC
ncbi:MAG: coenzyme F420-0:L-glutamate ligase [Patescibacteria group bacterium]